MNEENLPKEMGDDEASRYRAATARLNFLFQDNPDVQFVSKECSRRMARPHVDDWTLLKKAVRYLFGAPRLVYMYQWQYMITKFTIYSDSDWAKCRSSRKSTSGGALMHGSHLLRSYSKTLSTIALSNGVTELYALTTWCNEGLRLSAMARDYGEQKPPVVNVDASAAIGIAQRMGWDVCAISTRRHVGTGGST